MALGGHSFLLLTYEQTTEPNPRSEAGVLRPGRKFRDNGAPRLGSGDVASGPHSATPRRGASCAVMSLACAAPSHHCNEELGYRDCCGPFQCSRFPHSDLLYSQWKSNLLICVHLAQIWLTRASAVLYEQNFNFISTAKFIAAGLAVCDEGRVTTTMARSQEATCGQAARPLAGG